MRRAPLILILVLLAAGGVVAAIALASDDDNTTTATQEGPTGDVSNDVNTAVVSRKDFVEDTEVTGTLGFGTVETLPNLASGVITWLPEPGDVVGFGDTLYEIDGRPVLLLEGDRPMHRSLNSRSSDGPDVLRLEQMLVDLGHATESRLNIDDNFTSATADAIEEWEEAQGLEPTGEIALGSIVYRDEGFRIAEVNAIVGQQVNGGSILSHTSAERVVTVPLDTGLTGLLVEGQVVNVVLPDDTDVSGTVTFVGDVAVTDGQGPNATSYIEVLIVLDGEGAGFDESPVTIQVEEVLEEQAVVVPIASLLALAEGGYAVQVVDGDDLRLIGVELGTFHDNEVSIIGEVEPGAEVVVP